MHQLKIRNADLSQDYSLYDLSDEEWLQWKTVLVRAGACRPEDFEHNDKRLVITYYPGTLPARQEDEDILQLL